MAIQDATGVPPAANPAAAPALVVESISKAFGSVVAVRDLSFEAESGEVIGLLGPNGAGKTSAIRVLSTIYPPTTGRFSVCGVPHTDPGAIRPQIGVLPESAGYSLHQSGIEFLRYFARLFGYRGRRAKQIAQGLLTDVGLAERARSPISTYSRGMRQRLGVARALLNAPKVVFLDEPTLGLDPAGQRQILSLIHDVARERGATVILSTHFLDEVEETCSRVLILNKGQVIAEGTVADIKRKAAPSTARVRLPDESADSAQSVLKQVPGIAGVASFGGGAGWLSVTFDRASSADENAVASAALHALLDAGFQVLAFELEGRRLSDAFLHLTGEELP
jgi:ABC-2 type transport system ATP-binding protein